MKMYDARAFVVKLRIRHVRLFYQYAYRALETERDSRQHCVAIKRIRVEYYVTQRRHVARYCTYLRVCAHICTHV